MTNTQTLHDRIIVITGASSGFGEEIARRCAAAGARVVLAARTAGPLERLASSIGADRALAIPADVTNDEDVRRLVAATLERFGRVDVLVNNAGFGVFDRVEEAQLGDLEEMMKVNVFGAVRCTQAFLPYMRARRSGQIVMMASVAGLMASINMGFYCATKHALVAVSRTLMIELEGSGVRCALICPGVAQTGFQQRAGHAKFSRISRWTNCTAEQVGAATVQVIARRSHGEIVIPWYVRLLVLAGYPLPAATRLVMRVVR